MFKVTVDNNMFKFRFFKEHLMRRNPEEQWQRVSVNNGNGLGATLDALHSLGVETTYATHCVITDTEQHEVASGLTVLNPHDQPDRFTGKKIAMTRALKELGECFTLTKETKAKMWDALLNHMSMKRPHTCKCTLKLPRGFGKTMSEEDIKDPENNPF